VRLANRISRRHAFIAGHRLERAGGRNDHEHLFLADRRHLGTIGQGLMAQLVVSAMDVKFAARVAPLTDRDISRFARSFDSGAAVPGDVVRYAERTTVAPGVRTTPE
jgi:hypothetical protein